MKHSKNHFIKEMAESHELCLYAINGGRLNNHINSVAKSLARKMQRGIYDKVKAIDAVYPIATLAAKLYCAEFGGRYSQVFNVTCRYTVAAELLETIESLAQEYKEG